MSRDTHRGSATSEGTTPQQKSRQRHVHNKSRYGCRNCKARRVKCDEAKGSCQRCVASGITCNYGLDVATSRAPPPVLSRSSPPLSYQVDQNKIVWASINDSLNFENDVTQCRQESLRIRRPELELLNRFQVSTVLTMGDEATWEVYQEQCFRLACQHQFLLHLVLTMTMIHDRHLSSKPSSDISREAYHYAKGVALFNRAISKPVKGDAQDALWCAGVLLGGINMTSTEARTPQESWPLKPSEPEDLDWMKVSEGKHVVWRIANPQRPGGPFRNVMSMYDAIIVPSKDLDITALSEDFKQAFALNESSNEANNPYHLPATVIAVLRDVKCDRANITRFLTFLMAMPPAYRTLLEIKEPRALLLMAMWYGRIIEYGEWWVHRRASVECPSICLYLEKYHRDDAVLQRLLEGPKAACRLLELTRNSLSTEIV